MQKVLHDNVVTRQPAEAAPQPDTAPPRMSLSMHAGVEVWCDCCSCEAEPYWVEAFASTADDSADD